MSDTANTPQKRKGRPPREHRYSAIRVNMPEPMVLRIRQMGKDEVTGDIPYGKIAEYIIGLIQADFNRRDSILEKMGALRDIQPPSTTISHTTNL